MTSLGRDLGDWVTEREWRHQRDKHGVIHRAWSMPKVRSRATGERLWHAWCGRTNALGVKYTVVPDAVALTCFRCLCLSFEEEP